MKQHRVFLVALLLGIAVRVVVVLGFPPAFVFSDGPTYLDLADKLQPSLDRVVGYAVLLRVIGWFTHDVYAVAVVQHVLGLLTAVLAYALLRRWEVRGWVATLAVTPLLFDTLQLVLEHSVLADVAFDLLLLLGIAVLAWSRVPRVPAALVGGLLLGGSVLVKLAAQPVVVAAVVFCLVAAVGWRSKLLTTVALVVGFAAPLVGYAVWFHESYGVYGLSQSGGRALYMRTTGFVDCTRFEIPDYEQRLCPQAPVGERHDPTFYGWHRPDGTHGLEPPRGVTINQAFRDFATRAIHAQRSDYVGIVWRDVTMTFAVDRSDRYEYTTAHKWTFSGYRSWLPTDYTGPAYAAHGGRLLTLTQPYTTWLYAYENYGYVTGPVLLALLVVALLGLVVPNRALGPDAPRTRSLLFLLGSLGVGLVLVPDITAQFTWRYTLPAFVFVPMAAALAWTRLTTNAISSARARHRARTGRRVA